MLKVAAVRHYGNKVQGGWSFAKAKLSVELNGKPGTSCVYLREPWFSHL